MGIVAGASGSRHRQEPVVPRWTAGEGGPGEASSSTSRDSWHPHHHHHHQHLHQHHRLDLNRQSSPVPRELLRRSVIRPEPRQEMIPLANEPGTSERRTSNRGQNHRRIPTNPPTHDTLSTIQDHSLRTMNTVNSDNDEPKASEPLERPPTPPPPLHTTIRTTPIIFRDPIIASGQNDSQSSSGAYQVKWDSERKRRQGYFAPGSEKSPFRHYNKEDCQ